MQRSSDTIGAIAAAVAKAQTELTNPEKSLTAVIPSPFPRESAKSFRYASLASGLDLVRKTLGRYEVAIIQSTMIDWDARLIRLTTTLAHSSGEWIASDWPVCAVGDAETPHKLGTALTYARRYGLFTLVGIAGEDDLDAPDLLSSAAPAKSTAPSNNGYVGPINLGFDSQLNHPSVVTKSQGMARQAKAALRLPVLGPTESGAARDKLLEELVEISAERLTDWARATLPIKNRLRPIDADAISNAFTLRIENTDPAESQRSQSSMGSDIAAGQSKIDKSALTLGEPRRLRDKDHLRLVSAQNCLVCGRQPSDPHHLKFAQPRAMARKVSDEFVVPLCRVHHRELHHRGNERTWWAEQGIDPLPIAAALWAESRGTSHTSAQDTVNSAADTHRNRRRHASIAQLGT